MDGIGGIGLLTGDASCASDFSATTICVVLTSGKVDCWESNQFGKLGVQSATSEIYYPVALLVPS